MKVSNYEFDPFYLGLEGHLLAKETVLLDLINSWSIHYNEFKHKLCAGEQNRPNPLLCSNTSIVSECY